MLTFIQDYILSTEAAFKYKNFSFLEKDKYLSHTVLYFFFLLITALFSFYQQAFFKNIYRKFYLLVKMNDLLMFHFRIYLKTVTLYIVDKQREELLQKQYWLGKKQKFFLSVAIPVKKY